MGHTGTHAINPALYLDLRFDPVKDFQPITALISFNNILVVPAASPARSVAELVALAKARPAGLSYGSQGVGTGGHLLGELLARHAGAKLVHVPYRGIAPAVTDTVAARMDLRRARAAISRKSSRAPAPHVASQPPSMPPARPGRVDPGLPQLSHGGRM